MGIRRDVRACKKTSHKVKALLKEAYEKKEGEKDMKELQEYQDEIEELQWEKASKHQQVRPFCVVKKTNNVKSPHELLFIRNPETTIKLGKSKKQIIINNAHNMKSRARAFNVVNSKGFKLMIEAIRNFSTHLKVSSYYECRAPLLKKELKSKRGLLKSHTKERISGSRFVRNVDASRYRKLKHNYLSPWIVLLRRWENKIKCKCYEQ
ncbi:hypothetical protein CR513_55777, partial [Mucuna pruriens]